VTATPAVCQSCATLYAGESCPACGGTGPALGAIHGFAEDALVTLTTAEPFTAGQLQRLIRVVQDAQRGEASADDVGAALDREAPELALVTQGLLATRDAGQFYALLGLLLAILGFASAMKDDRMNDADIPMVAQDIVGRLIGKKAPMPVRPGTRMPQGKAPPPSPRKQRAVAKKGRRRR
jgi:hypothetical protein